MKKLSIILGLLLGVCTEYAMLVKLPNTETLRARLSDNGFYGLVSKTNIVDQLAYKHTNILNLFLDVKLILSSYEHELHDSQAALVLEKRKLELLGLILLGCPDALNELKSIFLTIED